MERRERQTRSAAREFRAQETDGKRYIEAYFAVFDSVYEIWPGETESIAPHAFDGALDDIRCLTDHLTHLVLGRTRVGTLELRTDAHGLWGRVEINPEDGDAMNLYARVKRGDVSQCSFGFDILEEEREARADGTVHYTIKRVKLYEVTICTFPAYKETSATARAAREAEHRRQRAREWKERMTRRLKKNGTQTGDAQLQD